MNTVYLKLSLLDLATDKNAAFSWPENAISLHTCSDSNDHSKWIQNSKALPKITPQVCREAKKAQCLDHSSDQNGRPPYFPAIRNDENLVLRDCFILHLGCLLHVCRPVTITWCE